jgi:hypothetical protein
MEKTLNGWLALPPERPLLALSVVVTSVLLLLILALTGPLAAFPLLFLLYLPGFGGLYALSFLRSRLAVATTRYWPLALEVAAAVAVVSFAAYVTGNSLRAVGLSVIYDRKDVFGWLDPYLLASAGRCLYYALAK